MSRILTLLPHVQCFGGVRRFIELGNQMVKRGHDFKIATGKTAWSKWMKIDFPIVDWDNPPEADHIFSGHATPGFFNTTMSPRFGSKSKKWMWVIHDGPMYLRTYKNAVNDRRWAGAFANNPKFSKLLAPYTVPVHIVPSGVNVNTFKTKKLRVGYYGAGRGAKNVPHIVKCLEGLDHVEPVPIEGYKGYDLVSMYQSLDIFVSWEGPGGWSNTSAEALSCGVPVVTNGGNCEPFIEHCTVVKDLRAHFVALGERMNPFSWESTVDRVIRVMGI